jgi:DNA mismatch endonuclease (patch repair protein)
MADRLSPERRSWNMSRIRSRDTRPERLVRSLLHRMGYRFRIGNRNLPGNPDVVLTKYRTVILVHGCFWHRHPSCKFAYAPKSQIDFWQRKFRENVARDCKTETLLREAGWKVIVIWECEIADALTLGKRLQQEVGSGTGLKLGGC